MIFDGGGEHEQVVFCHDRATGLRCIIAIYSTALGPSLGGTRFYPFPSEQAALDDVLDLSRAMAYKNAVAGLPHGGGKAVIIGDPATDKSPDLLRAYGRFVQSLGGRYITACDVGTYVADMDVVAETCDYVTGRSEAAGGAGDSSVLTAFGVYRAMLASARFRWSVSGLDGRRLGVIGIGKVGRHLIDLAAADGATIVATDVDSDAVDWVRRTHPHVTIAGSDHEVTVADVDILAPCALGGAVTDENVDAIRAAVICGAANNQLAHDGLDNRLLERGILYCPDFVVNSGGVIQVADERNGFDFDRAKAKTAQVYDTTIEILELAAAKGVTPTEAATHIGDERMAAVSKNLHGCERPSASEGAAASDGRRGRGTH